jgi:hypothetical protein
MKSALVFKLLFAIGLGVVYGESIQLDHAKWRSLGRDAFLAFQSHRFDAFMVHPSPGAVYVAISVLFGVGLFALYEVTGYLGEKLVSFLMQQRTSQP